MSSIEDTDEDVKALVGLGVDKLKERLKEYMEKYKNTPVNIAVTGMSGSGKSSFINRIRDLKPKDEYAAKVGVTETTTDRRSYEFPDNKLIKIWDLPGAETEKFPINTYAKDMKFEEYDAFVILTKDRFLETDKKIAQIITESRKPFFFGRTKTDTAMKNEAMDNADNFEPNITKELIKKNCKDELDDHCRDVFLLAKVHSIKIRAGKKTEDVEFPDNERLKEQITNSLEGIQKTALIFHLKNSKDLLELKVEELRRRVKWLAMASAAGGAIPIPGMTALIDIPLLVSEAMFQRKQLGIDDDDMKRNAARVDVEGKLTFMGNVKGRLKGGAVVFLSSAVNLTGIIVGQVAATEAVESSLKVIPVIGQVLGSVAGAGIAGSMSYRTLKNMLNAHKEIAEATLDVISDEAH